MISVIIPMYNAQDTILNAVKSVLNQTYTGEVEIIVVDDGSMDNGYEVIDQFRIQNNVCNLHIIKKANGGVSSARNVGLLMAKGDYIALLDSDDEWSTTKLEKQMKYLDRYPDIDFIGCNRNNEKIFFPYKDNDGIINVTLKKLLLKNKPQTSTAVFKRKILENTGLYNEKLKYGEDANYWMRISISNNMKMLSESLVMTGSGKRNYGVKGLSSNMWQMEKGELMNLIEIQKLGHINKLQFSFLTTFSLLKYIKRIVVVYIFK